MISIVICSINPDFLRQIKQNISDTIGLEYELLIWDNRVAKIGICEVYNKMANKAIYDIICFVHEDILFENKGWGQELVSQFQSRTELGIAGVAGSKYKAAAYSGWYTGINEFDCANIVHFEEGKRRHIYLRPGTTNNKYEDVVSIDGVFISCRKDIWQRIKFNEELLKGFHYYDIDFGLRATALCKVSVLYNINIVHITKGGDFGDNWVEITVLIHGYFRKLLPLSCPGVVIREGIEKRIKKTWLDLLKNQKVSFMNRLKWIRDGKLYLYPDLFYSILKFMFYRPLGLRYIHKRKP
jgi:hypothetical protein